MYIKNQNFLIFGISKSGFSVANYILQNGGNCYLYEEVNNEQSKKNIEELVEKKAIKLELEFIKKNIDIFDMLILSPGVPINHPLAVFFKENNKRVTGELEFAYSMFQPSIVAVTGTNGKTTTVSLINSVLEKSEIDGRLVGNVGIPFSSKIEEMSKNSVVVCEVSSFQLETTRKFSPNIACILNISPNHLDRHYSMENYIFLKKKLLQSQSENDIAILNYDDEIVRGFNEKIKSKVKYISVKEKTNGAYIEDGFFCYENEKIIETNKVSLSGEHNYYNILFCIAVCKALNVNNECICDAVCNFKGVKHRLEFVKEINGVRYINDSKSTNTLSTINAIKSIERPTILILGGSEKGEKYDELFKMIKYYGIKQVVITGASRYNMMKSAVSAEYNTFSVIPDFDYAVRTASMLSRSGDVVLLSPACASFDAFQNFEERGEKFISIINAL